MFSSEFPEISKNSFFKVHLRTTDSVWWMELFSKQDPSEMLDRVLNTFLKRAEAVNMKRKTILIYIPFSSYMRKLFKKILDPCSHTTLFQRRYDVVRHRTTSHRLWNDVVCLQEVWTSEAYSEPSRRYKMELLAKMVKCWKLHLIC